MARSAAIWLLGVTIAGVTVAFVATCSGADDDAPREDGQAAPSVRGPEPRPRSRDRGASQTPTGTAVSADPGANREESDQEFDLGFPSIDVEVVRADGTLVAGARVYALRAGSAGSDDVYSVPGDGTGESGVAQLAVPVPGTYDVGATIGRLFAMATDVEIPAARPIRIVLPKEAEVLVSATPDAAALLEANARITLEPEGDRRFVRGCPGRGEAFGWASEMSMPPRQKELRVEVPEGTVVAARATIGLSVAPAKVSAPGIIRVDTRPEFSVRIGARITWPDGAAPRGYLAVEFDPGPGGSPPGEHLRVDLDEDPPRADAKSKIAFARFRVGAPSGVLRWRGYGVIADSATYGPFTVGADNFFEVAIRLDGTPLPAAPPPPPGMRESTSVKLVVSDPLRATDPVACFVTGADGGGDDSAVTPGEVATCSVVDPVWVVACKARQVAGPVRVAASGAVNRLTLAPAGWVRLVLESVPSANIGRITAERADGVPVLARGLVARAEIYGSRELGPMAPGAVEFIIRAGDHELRRVRASVVAGETTEVVIPKLSGR